MLNSTLSQYGCYVASVDGRMVTECEAGGRVDIDRRFHSCGLEATDLTKCGYLFFVQPASYQWALRPLSPKVKRPCREADLSPPASAENKKTCVYTTTPSYVFMA
jgi:hypothetical protein